MYATGGPPQTNYSYEEDPGVYQTEDQQDFAPGDDPEVAYDEEDEVVYSEDDPNNNVYDADQPQDAPGVGNGEQFQDEMGGQGGGAMDAYGQDPQALALQQQYEMQQYQQQQAYQEQQYMQQQAYYAQQQRQQQQFGEQARARQDKKDGQRKTLQAFLCLALLALVVALAGVGVLLYFWLSDDDDDDKTVVVNATTAPTPPPTPQPSPTVPPTDPPTQSPTASTPQFSRSGSTLTGVSAAGFGSVVAMADNTIVAASPDFGASSGQIQGFSRSGNNQPFSNAGSATAALTEEFGSDVDICIDSNGDPFLVVGAARTKGVLDGNTNDRFGGAFAFLHNGNSWEQVGGGIRSPTEVLQEAGGRLGDAVACAWDISRVAVCSPSSSTDIDNLDTGRCFIYDLVDGSWTSIQTPALMGTAGSYFGEAIDMTRDGLRLIVGAPFKKTSFSPGEVFVFEFNSGTNEFEEVFKSTGTATEKLGTTVKIINQAGTQFAVGGPEFDGGKGVVRVFEESGGTFTQLGSDIEGFASGEKVGTSLCGNNGVVAFGTENGDVRIYEFTTDWGEKVPGTNAGGKVVSCAVSSTGNEVVVGLDTEEVIIYKIS